MSTLERQRLLHVLIAPMITPAMVLGASAARADDSQAPGIDFEQFAQFIQQADLSEEEIRELIDIVDLIKERTKERLTFAQRAKRALLQPWVVFGFVAQFIFGMRFVWQLIVSEHKKRSHVPVAFWYLSLIGGLMLFTYACKLRDPVFMAGQGLGVFIYVRNLTLIHRHRTPTVDDPADRSPGDAATDTNADGTNTP